MPFDILAVAKAIGLSGGWLIAFILGCWLIFMPEKVERVRALVLGGLSWLGSGIRRGYHTASIRTVLNPQIANLREQLGIAEELPELEVRFASKGGARPTFENGRVIVFLRDATASRAENVVKAAMHYVGSSVYPHARAFMNEPTNKALDLALTRRLLQPDRDALRHYTRYFVEDMCRVDPSINRIYGQISNIDERGLLPGVLLHQLGALALRLGPAHYHGFDVQMEVVGFIRFLEGIATRERAEIGQLDFNIKYIRVKFILLGRDETLDEQGFQPYMRHLARAMMSGYSGVYVLGAGRKAKLVKEFLEGIERNAYYRERIAEVALEERVLTHADRKSDRAIGYIAFRRRTSEYQPTLLTRSDLDINDTPGTSRPS